MKKIKQITQGYREVEIADEEWDGEIFQAHENVIFGLGDDNRIYYWDTQNEVWVLYTTKN